ncbi:FAD-dependent oxidoreductase [Tardiphaga sp. OK245]|uniref:NAD(P)/FAD-dependent oxidoreductase n=1 Tax=Tardiphaga sp. OK245 TaxID=1855306 RepID=UPI0008A79F62|nr:FAD-dependent oxidoreductase [Tardiphaga sp. OK245]SEI08348.1 Glycine/D-amino acid oxidase [Tardiphaga sp. OK245]
MRGGRSPWFAGLQHAPRQPLTEDITCDALIVGGGITGALMAEQLTRQGLDVVIVDRELPGRGSTVASTSMLLWEIDRSLQELTHLYGYERAARAYRASYDAVHGLKALVRTLNLRCDMRAKDSLYLAAGESAKGLIDEHALRARAGLPGTLLDHKTLLSEYDIARAGAIISPDSADSDPLQLALGLLNVATARGARLFEAETAAFDSAGHAVGVQLTDGHTIEARHVVLATGYVMPDIVHTTVQKPSSSWAIATKPQPDRLWRDGVLIWEDSKDYLYARTTASGRIIIGGEDSDEIIDPDARDALIPAKARALKEKLASLWPRAELAIDYRWAGTFDTTRDGLPLIGPVPGHPHLYAAYGYGGNGITFSYLAAQLIGGMIAGKRSPLLDDFALQRDIA